MIEEGVHPSLSNTVTLQLNDKVEVVFDAVGRREREESRSIITRCSKLAPDRETNELEF